MCHRSIRIKILNLPKVHDLENPGKVVLNQETNLPTNPVLNRELKRKRGRKSDRKILMSDMAGADHYCTVQLFVFKDSGLTYSLNNSILQIL